MLHILNCHQHTETADLLGALRPVRAKDEADAKAALGRFPHVYQAAADEAVPIWNLRHG